jgi:uncharacterized membrane protein YjgN (DUF898 family)
MTVTLSPEAADAVPDRATMSFSGRAGEFLRLLVTGSLLQVPTFGFYRFWLLTKLRRHLWANTRVGDEGFEYTGTAKEILLGFLIALAILVPVYIIYFALGILAEEQQALASLPLAALMYLLTHFAGYRARRYRATRTIFRGVRFSMTGSGWGYAFRAILWDLLVIMTLGLALPWASASLERYRMRHTHFGSLQGDFVATGGSLFKRGWWLWLLSVLAPVGLATLIGLARQGNEHAALIFSGSVTVVVLVSWLLAYPIFLAIYARWQIEGIRFGDVSLSSNLRKRAFFGTFVRLILSSLGFLIFFMVVATVFIIAFREPLEALKTGELNLATGSIAALAALGYLALLLGFGVIRRYFMSRGLWAIIAGSIVVNDLSAIDSVVAAGQSASAVGEGLADALDFGAGL